MPKISNLNAKSIIIKFVLKSIIFTAYCSFTEKMVECKHLLKVSR